METASVFKNLFEDGPRGLCDAWTSSLNSMRVPGESVNTLGTPDVYTLPFPSDLSGQQHLNNVTFSTSCPRPAVVNRPDRKATASIVRTLVASLNRDLSAGLDPAIISARVAEADGPTAAQDNETLPAKRFVVFGASHMKRVVPLMLAQGCSVADLTIPGWMPNVKNNAELCETLASVAKTPGTVFVLDLLGNMSTRYTTSDDTTAPAVKFGRGGGGTCQGTSLGPLTKALRRLSAVSAQRWQSLTTQTKYSSPPSRGTCSAVVARTALMRPTHTTRSTQKTLSLITYASEAN